MLVILCFTNASFNSENPELLNNSNSGCVDGSYKRMAQNETIISLGCINFLPTYNWYGHVAGTQGERNDEQLHVVVSESALDVEDMTYCNDAFPSIYIRIVDVTLKTPPVSICLDFRRPWAHHFTYMHAAFSFILRMHTNWAKFDCVRSSLHISTYTHKIRKATRFLLFDFVIVWRWNGLIENKKVNLDCDIYWHVENLLSSRTRNHNSIELRI